MELCTTQSPSHLPKISAATRQHQHHLFSKTSLLLKPCLRRRLRFHSRFVYFSKSVPRASFSEERDGAALAVEVEVEDVPAAVEKNVYGESGPTEVSKQEKEQEDESSADAQANEFLANLNFNPEDTYSILLYGGGAVVALWLTSAVVGAIDSIPVFPKLMEVVGLGYTFWFTTRYLLFKENRDELASKIEELKRQVLGSGD